MKSHFLPKLTILAFSVLLSVCGCTKNTTTPTQSGNIFGIGFLYDQYGDRVMSNLAGDSIKIQNSGTAVITDANGHYTLSSLNEGIYSFTYSKAGYGNMQLNNAQFIGGGNTEHDFKLASIPDFNVSTIDSSNLTNTNNLVTVRVYGTLSSVDPLPRTVLLLVGANSNVSTNPATYSLNYTGKTILNAKTGAYTTQYLVSIPVNELYDAGFAKGSTIYIAATGVSGVGNTASIYEDPTTGRSVYTAVSAGTPQVKTVTVP